MGIKHLAAAIIAVAVIAAPAFGQSPPTILYAKAPWVVFRIMDPQGSRCDAQIKTERGLFQVVAIPGFATITVEDRDWKFAQHEGSLTLKVGISAIILKGALYRQDYVAIGSNAKAIYLLIQMINRPGELEIRGDENRPLATFPFDGMPKALEVWKACADGLPAS